jgi:UDP-N-acetyl-D-glucosamine dehydrogenase
MSDLAQSLRRRIETREAIIGVLGLGYVGLPLARAFSRRGIRVLGFDVDPEKVERLGRCESYLGSIPDAEIAEMQQSGFKATCDFKRLAEPDALLICVPTPLTPTREPDLTFVRQSAESIAAALRPGQLVVLESTTYPGTTRQVILPILARTGLEIGKEVFLAYSPEREDPGHPEHTLTELPKVVGGLARHDRALACALYQCVAKSVVPVSSLDVAEACKILENTYRAVNIALVNELKVLFGRMGIDVWEVIEAAKTKPFGFQAFYPGPGLGGHCIPVDPFYLAWVARTYGVNTRFIELAGEINTSMPSYVVGKITDALNVRGLAVKGSRILLLGMAYKRDVGDPRESPGFEILELLLRKGAQVEYSDPHIPRLPSMRRWPKHDLESRPLTDDVLAAQDCVVIVTDHRAFDWEVIVKKARLIVDTRNATRKWLSDCRDKIVLA